MTTITGQVQAIRMALKKGYEVWAKKDGECYHVYAAYGREKSLQAVISLYVIPDRYQIDEGVTKELHYGDKKAVEEIIEAFFKKQVVVVGWRKMQYHVAGIKHSSSNNLFEVLIREPITPEKWWIVKCKEHQTCMNGHCHEPGCQHYEDLCQDQLRDWAEQQAIEMAAERANEEALYKIEIPRW